MGIAENIRCYRLAAGYSQKFLARLLNVDKGTVGVWERGINRPKSDNVCKLSKIFKVSSDELLGLKTAASAATEEFGLEFRPDFRQEANLEIERQALSLSDIMDEKGVSRRELAKALDVTPKTVYNWQNKGLPSLREYQKIFTVLDLDANTFCALRK